MAKIDTDSLFTKDQIDSAKDLYDVIKGLAAEMEALRKAQGSQIEVSRQLASAFGEVEKSVEDTTEKMEKLKAQRLKEFKDEVKNAKSVTELASKAAAYYAEEVQKKYPVAFGMATGAVMGFKQGLTNMMAVIKVGVGVVKTLAGTLFALGGAILSIPFKMFSAIIDIADSAGGGTDELREAIENLRGEYGALGQETPQAIMKTAKELKGFSDTGLSAFRIFGNMANRLKEVAQLATEMGAVFESFTDEFVENGGAILAWQRGLGLSGEQMKTIGQRAKTMGTTMSEELMTIQKLSQGMGNEFGIAAKNISKDMATAAADVKHFGGATVKQMAQASVYARKLGVELDKIVGILDAFDTFENAAQNASKLSQAFGVQIDAFKMMKAQSPDEQIDMVRQAFARAGKDASAFNRQQIGLLSSTTGLDAGIAKQAFSLKNQGVSLDKVRASAEKSEKRTLSQAEAMKELADAIKRMTQSGGGDGAKGFFAKFLAGISRGIQSTATFRTMIWSIRGAMRETRMQGVQLGRALVENFPGMKKFFEGIRGFFKRENFRPLIKGVTDDLIGFVKGFSSGRYSFEDLMKNLRKRFFDYFNRSSESGRKMVDGFKQMFAAISKIASEAIRWISSKVKDGIMFVTDLITGKRKLGDVSGLGFFANALGPLFEAFKYAWQEIIPVLMEALSVIGDKVLGWIKEKLIPLLLDMAPYIALAIFGPALIRALLGALAGAVGAKLLVVGKQFVSKMFPKAPIAAEVAKAVTPPPPIPGIGPSQKSGSGRGKSSFFSKLTAGQNPLKKMGMKMLALGGFILTAGIAIAGAIVAINVVMGDMTLQRALSIMLLITSVALAAIPLALALKMVTPLIKRGTLKKGLGAMALMIGGMGLIAAGLGLLFSAVSTEVLTGTGKLMLAMAGVFLAMIPVVLAAAALGAILMIPVVGQIVAGAMVAGFAALGAAVLGMAGVAVEIIKILSAVNVGTDIKAKTDAFVDVMKAISPFAQTVADIMHDLQPSLFELLRGTGFQDKIDAAVKFIVALFGDEKNRVGITALLDKVVSILEVFTTKQGIGTAARIFSDVMTGMSAAMKALAPPPEFYDQITNWLGVDNSLIQKVVPYINTMGAQLVNLINVVVPIVEKLLSTNIPSSSAVGAIANIISAVGSLVQALSPNPEFLNAFKTSTDVAWGLYSNTDIDTEKMGTFFKTYMDAIKPVVKAFSSEVIDEILKAVSGVDAGKLEKLGPLSEIMKAVAELVKTIAAPGKIPEIDPKKIGGMGNVINISNVLPDFGQVLQQVGEKMGPFIGHLVRAVQGIPADDKVFMQKLEAAKTLFSLLGEIRGLIDAVPKEQEVAGEKASIPPSLGEKLLESVDSINQFLRGLAGTKLSSLLTNIEKLGQQLVPQRGKSPIGKTMKTLSEFFNDLSSSVGSMKSVAEMDLPNATVFDLKMILLQQVVGSLVSKMEKLKSTLSQEAVNSAVAVGKRFKDYGTGLGNMAKSIEEGGIKTSLQAVSDVIQKVNEINNALSAPTTLDVGSKLKVLANNIGMGSDASFEIKSRPANITINLKVEMNAKDMEKAIVMRAESVIRDRLNFATNDFPSDKASRPIPPSGELPGVPVQTGGATSLGPRSP